MIVVLPLHVKIETGLNAVAYRPRVPPRLPDSPRSQERHRRTAPAQHTSRQNLAGVVVEYKQFSPFQNRRNSAIQRDRQIGPFVRPGGEKRLSDHEIAPHFRPCPCSRRGRACAAVHTLFYPRYPDHHPSRRASCRDHHGGRPGRDARQRHPDGALGGPDPDVPA